MRMALYLAVSLLAVESYAASDTINLQCGTISGFKTEAELKIVPRQEVRIVNLTFIGAKPSNKDIDRLLRECAAIAIKREPTKNILISAWVRKRSGDNWRDDDLLQPYGATKFLSYTASTKSIAVRDMDLKKK